MSIRVFPEMFNRAGKTYSSDGLRHSMSEAHTLSKLRTSLHLSLSPDCRCPVICCLTLRPHLPHNDRLHSQTVSQKKKTNASFLILIHGYFVTVMRAVRRSSLAACSFNDLHQTLTSQLTLSVSSTVRSKFLSFIKALP